MDKTDRDELARLLCDPPIEDRAFVGQLIERFLRDRGYIRTDKIIGLKEASVLTGTPVSTLASRTWRRTPGWPAPIRTIACGPLFDVDAVTSANVDPRGRSARSQNGRTVTA